MPYLGTSHNNSVVHISRCAMNILLGNGNDAVLQLDNWLGVAIGRVLMASI